MTITTQTAPISTDQRNTIKLKLAQLIADSESVDLPKEFGCAPDKLAMIEGSLDAPARELLRQVPSDDRRAVLALAVSPAIAIRAEAAKRKMQEAQEARQRK